jgi:DNA-binding CsgD family transcriptional regulator
MYAVSARLGVIVVDTSLALLASNPDAVQILTFPENPDRIPDFEKWLANRVRSRLIDRRSESPSGLVHHFKSAKRTYLCRSFPINVRMEAPAPASPAMLLLLERTSNGSITMDQIARRYGLTRREQETVKLLLRGLTSKEIADYMKISPNTVKAFIRLVMVKMKVSTRSGIIGKIADGHYVETRG